MRSGQPERIAEAVVVVLFVGVFGGFAAYFFSERIVDEDSMSYDWGFREGTQVSEEDNPFEHTARDDWDELADQLYDEHVDYLRSECDPPPTWDGPADYEDYAAGQVAGMHEKAVTGNELGFIGEQKGLWEWDCD